MHWPTGLPRLPHARGRLATWAWSWLTWPAAARSLRRQGWHHIGFATWQSPHPDRMRLRP